MNYKEFEKKVKSMSAHDIIMAMVEGLRQPRTEIDMGTFGDMEDGICYGCAATNAILNIMEVKEDEIKDYIYGCESFADKPSEVCMFESAIDCLRQGNVYQYNRYAMNVGFALIATMPGQVLPRLENDYTEEQLQEYVKLAEYQLTRIMENLTFDKLPEAVTMLTKEISELKRLLIEKQDQTPPPPPEQLLTVHEAAKFLSLTAPTIYSKASRGELPVMKRGKRLYFSSTELLEYIKGGRKKVKR